MENAKRYLTYPTGKSRAQYRESSYTIGSQQNTRGGNNAKSRKRAPATSRGAQASAVTVREVIPSNFSDRIPKRLWSIPQGNPSDPHRIGSFTAQNGAGATSAMGEGESTQCYSDWIEARQAHNFSRRQKENRSGSAGEVGEGEGGDKIEPKPSTAPRNGSWRNATPAGRAR